jgi:hypothetical protein
VQGLDNILKQNGHETSDAVGADAQIGVEDVSAWIADDPHELCGLPLVDFPHGRLRVDRAGP